MITTLTRLEGLIKVMNAMNHFNPDSEEQKILKKAISDLEEVYQKRKDDELEEESYVRKIRFENEIETLKKEDLDIIAERSKLRNEGIKELMQKKELTAEEENFLNELLDEEKVFKAAGLD